jgi:hypothetical protein
MSNEIFSKGDEYDKFQWKMNFYTLIIVFPILIFLGYQSIKNQKNKFNNFVQQEFKNYQINLSFDGRIDRIFLKGQDFDIRIIELIKNDSIYLSGQEFEGIINKERIKLNISKKINDDRFVFNYNNDNYQLVFEEHISIHNWIYETFK